MLHRNSGSSSLAEVSRTIFTKLHNNTCVGCPWDHPPKTHYRRFSLRKGAEYRPIFTALSQAGDVEMDKGEDTGHLLRTKPFKTSIDRLSHLLVGPRTRWQVSISNIETVFVQADTVHAGLIHFVYPAPNFSGETNRLPCAPKLDGPGNKRVVDYT
jgi:hypothetical protein